MTALADGIGYFAVFLGLFSYVSTKRKPIYIMKGVTDALWVVNLAMYGMYTATFINCMNIGRTVVFYYREEKAWAGHRAWLALFLSVAVVAPCLTWAGPISLLPTFGSILCCIGFYLHNTLAVKWVLLPGNLIWMTYSILSHNPSAALGNIIVVISLAVGIVREMGKRRKKIV